MEYTSFLKYLYGSPFHHALVSCRDRCALLGYVREVALSLYRSFQKSVRLDFCRDFVKVTTKVLTFDTLVVI